MQQAQKDILVTIGIFAALVVVATTVGYLLAREGGSVIAAAFAGALLSAGVLALYGTCYQLWAHVAWGAPFLIGDTVKIAKGPHAGAEARVVSLGQGVEVEVEFELRGQLHREALRWSAIRKIIPHAV